MAQRPQPAGLPRKISDCKSQKYINTLAQAEKMDSTFLQHEPEKWQWFCIFSVINTIFERNLVVFKFSPQTWVLRSPAMYILNDIFVQVERGESLGRIISLEMQGGAGRGGGRREAEEGTEGRNRSIYPYCL